MHFYDPKRISWFDIRVGTSYSDTNTAYDEVPERPNMWYIFEKRIVQGYQKLYSHVSNAQMQSKVPERPNTWYIFKKAIVQGCLLSLAQLYKV